MEQLLVYYLLSVGLQYKDGERKLKLADWLIMQNRMSYKVAVWCCCIGMSCRHQKYPKFLFTGEPDKTASAPLGALAVRSEKVGVLAFQLESSS